MSTIYTCWRSPLYVAEDATDLREAVQEAVSNGSNLRGAALRGANLQGVVIWGAALQGADLQSADLRDADLRDVNLRSADLRYTDFRRADLRGADLRNADLRGADLQGADLGYNAYHQGADLQGADLRGTKGIVQERSNDLLLLFDQVGKIRAYKLVNQDGDSIYARGQGYKPIRYEVGKTYKVENANTDPQIECSAGISVATLPWCLRAWKPGYRVLIVEFSRKDIAAIPNSDGKFRLHRCRVVGEKKIDPVALGLVAEQEQVWA